MGTNPRLPTGFFEHMRPEIKAQYPGRSKGSVDRIIAGIFWKASPESQARIIRAYDSIKPNPVQMLECPSCHYAKNPVNRQGVFLKCGKCHKNLVSVRIRRK